MEGGGDTASQDTRVGARASVQQLAGSPGFAEAGAHSWAALILGLTWLHSDDTGRLYRST